MICPVTGKPCGMPKNVVINEVVDGNVKTIRLCHQCAPAYLNSEKMSLSQLPVLHPHNPQHPQHPQVASPGKLLSELLAYFQGKTQPQLPQPVQQPPLVLERLTQDEQPVEPQPVPVKSSKIDEEIRKYEAILMEAIRTEQFEDCIKIRDVIRMLKAIKEEKAIAIAELQAAAENEDNDGVLTASAKIAELSKRFAALVI